MSATGPSRRSPLARRGAPTSGSPAVSPKRSGWRDGGPERGRRMGAAAWRAVLLALLSLSLVGCVRGCSSGRPPIHLNPNMDLQPKYRAQAESGFFYDGATMRPPVPGTVARGELYEDQAVYSGRDEAGELVADNPMPVDDALLARGADRYAIYCAPCHDMRGTGKGILSQRGGVPTTSVLDPRLVGETDGYLYDVITNGLGLMPGYRWPLRPEDRWAIVAHVRRLQTR